MNETCAVVTGASGGIGRAVARRLREDGCVVYNFSRHPGPDADIRFVACDVTNSAAVEAAFDRVAAEVGRIDVLVNNAGMGISGAVEFTPEAEVRRQMEVNLFGAMACTRQVIGRMRGQGGGKIVFISSLAAIFPIPFQSFYAISKAGVNCFADALGLEVKPFGIETCTVLLNDVRTGFTDSRRKSACGDEIYGGRIEASVGKMERSERSGMTPECVADAVARLLMRRHLPPHKIVGASNELLGLLYRLLPSAAMLRLLYRIYGS